MTLAEVWQAARDGMQGVFLKPIARLLARKTTQQTARVRLITHRRELCRASLRPVDERCLTQPVERQRPGGVKNRVCDGADVRIDAFQIADQVNMQ